MDRSRNHAQPVVEGMDPVRPVACEERRRRETETRRVSRDHVDGVEATRDAIAATTSSSSSFLTLSQHQ